MEIKHSDIVAVMDIVGSEDAQKYLDCGWILLNTASVQGGENGGILYSLGWSSTRGNIVKPKSNYQTLK